MFFVYDILKTDITFILLPNRIFMHRCWLKVKKNSGLKFEAIKTDIDVKTSKKLFKKIWQTNVVIKLQKRF